MRESEESRGRVGKEAGRRERGEKWGRNRGEREGEGQGKKREEEEGAAGRGGSQERKREENTNKNKVIKEKSTEHELNTQKPNQPKQRS